MPCFGQSSRTGKQKMSGGAHWGYKETERRLQNVDPLTGAHMRSQAGGQAVLSSSSSCFDRHALC